MSKVLSLALKINADASGLKLDPVERALKRLGDETDKVTKIFDKFADTSESAARSQSETAKAISDLTNARKSGVITAEAFAEQFERISKAANQEAAALERAAKITEANITPQQRFAKATSELREQLQAGRISQETFNRAMEKARSDLAGAGNAAKAAESSLSGVAGQLRLIATIEVGRVAVSGLRTIANSAQQFVSQISGVVSGVTQSLDAIDKLAIKTGIGTEKLQGYAVAANLAGIDTQQFAAAATKLTVELGRATPGDKLDKSLRGINLSVQELRSLSPDRQFAAITQAISQVPGEAERAALAVQIFGRAGADLGPLFREGAAGLEEITQRANRLGIIVSQTQIDNVTKMNDTFELVSATINGIIGQVAGNLAPIVTAIAEEFLQFVETFEGASGEGGTGIANAITNVLLDGAEVLAGVFDSFVGQFDGFSVSLQTAADIFSATGQAFYGTFEGLRAVFNVFELAGNALLIGLGKILEGLGSWVSSDLERAGQELQAAGFAAAQQNSRELEEAAANAGKAFTNVLNSGAGSAAAAGEGAASEFIQGVRRKLEREQAPEFKVATNLEATGNKLASFLEKAGEEADQFYVASLQTVEAFKEQAAAGELSAAQIEIMTGFAEKLNTQLDAELAKRREATEAATAQAEADAKRINSLLQTSDATSKLLEDLAVVDREIARVQQDIASSAGQDSGGQDRLLQLQQLQAQLDEQLQATSQGFAEGFDKAFAQTSQSISQLTQQAVEFGDAGFAAALQLQDGIAAAQQQARDGILNAAAFQQEVARQQELFNRQVADIRELAEERRRVNELVDQQLELARFNGDSQRLQASKNLIAIEAEIARVTAEVNKARADGDRQALAAGIERLGQLDQVAAKERDIANGQAKAREEQRKFFEEQARRAEESAKAEQQRQQQLAQARAQEEQRRREASEKEFARQSAIIRELRRAGQQTIGGGDIRTQAGAQQFLDAAAGRFDPRAAEQLRIQREQLKFLKALAEKIIPEAVGYLEAGAATTVSFLGGRP
jgi:hypothetical protein